MHQHPLSPQRGVSRRTLAIAIAVVLTAQAITVYAVHRLTSAHAPTPAAALPAPADAPRRQAGGFGRSISVPENPPAAEPIGPRGATAGAVTQGPVAVRQGVSHSSRWSDRPLDEAGQKLAEDVGRPADDLRLLADERGRVTDAARRDLLAGREAATQIAQELGLTGDGEDRLAQIMVGFMVRRVVMRAAFQGTPVTPEAIDDAVRADTLRAAEGNLDAHAKDAVASKLAALPDLTADLPPAR